MANYRPVTALKAVTFTEKIDTHLYDKLSAYRKTHSCEIKLTRLMEDWRKAMDNEECVAVLSTDMSKAFEKLDHALMIKKLVLRALRSYFIEPKNCVKISNMTSTWKDQLRGCPQGSPLCPLLWILFQNDLSLNVLTSNLFMYADDHDR